MHNICFLVHNCADYGGVEKVASNIANELSKKHTVYVASVINDGRPNRLFLKNDIKVTKFIPAGLRLREQQAKLFGPLRKYLKENRIDVLIIMGHYSGFLAAPVRLFTKSKFVFCDHGAIMNQWDDLKNRTMRTIASKACDITVTLTERSRNDYIKRLHIKPERIRCIYNWIAPELIEPVKYDINSKRVLSVGRLGEEKGFDLLIKIFSKVVEKHPDWHLDIYGDGTEYERLVSEIRQKELDSNIHMMGMDPDVISKYDQYSLYALPSYKEGLPLVLLEAKAKGLPIVSFDILTGPKEIVQEGVNGFLIPPYDIDAFADSICRLIDEPEMRVSMSNHAKDNIGKFEKTTIFRQWELLIEGVLR
jgi:glycosyltransferase involved in cell wall biosynthesis